MNSHLLLWGISMAFVRATIVIDELIAHRVRQSFGGNLSKGVNEMLREHLDESDGDAPFFGALKGRISVKDLEALDREEEEADRRDPLLRR
jgi:hypothetical protein